ncbi:MAG: NAD-binding protein [Candidatus Competibacterales bacterium]|nr:NAD-binding protein [Candidatus Competibacterales bacterium]
MLLYERLLVIRARRGATPAADAIEAQRPVVIAGFGRFGQIIVRLLHAKGVDATVIDHDPGQIELVRRFGYKAYYGDISRIDLLRAAGLERARLFILAIDDTATALATAKRVRAEYPQVRIMARVRNRQDVYDFMRLDVPVIVRETFGSALDMGEEALKALGIGAYRARRIVQRFRRHDLETIRHLYPHHQDEPTLISKTKEAREDLARLMRDEGGTPLTDSDWD